MTAPKVITATTPLEKAALKATFDAALGDWYCMFFDNVLHYLYDELGLTNDDDGAQLNIDELSDLMDRWTRSLG